MLDWIDPSDNLPVIPKGDPMIRILVWIDGFVEEGIYVGNGCFHSDSSFNVMPKRWAYFNAPDLN